MKKQLFARCEQNKPLSEVSTLGIGGPARYFLEVNTVEDLAEAIRECNQEKIPYILLGKGSNTLFDDRGFCGVVILNRIMGLEEEGDLIHVGAGYSFSLLGVQMARKGRAGLEFASGIPGTVGGAVYMNAGANGGETANILVDVDYVTETGDVQKVLREQMNFAYRISSFQGKKGAIARATFRLTDSPEARKRQLEIVEYRTRTQPYSDKSAGCVFRNPMPTSAGALIDQCGLKGMKVGGAEVSLLHANFIVNKGGATAADVLTLAQTIKSQVLEKTGIALEMEVRFQPYDADSVSS